MSQQLSEPEVVRRRLSPERLHPYLTAAYGDLDGALALYAWNADLSAAVAKTIGHVEIILRNALHETLVDWSAKRFGDERWYLDPGRYLQPRATEDIRAARRRATQTGRSETSGRVVAELNLGFWRFLLAKHYDETLWRSALYRAFPGENRRRVIHDAATVLHLCRNRVAHHEPIFNRPIGDIRFAVLALADWICPVGRAWIERRCRIEAAWMERP
nr:Abi family protein [uncultured Actinoplanes sp.]